MADINRLIPVNTLKVSMQNRLWAGGRRGTNVIWQDRGSSVVVYPTTLRIRLDGGWMMTSVDLETDQTGRETVEMAFFLGRTKQGDGLVATSTLEGEDPSGLRTRWGGMVQTALWEGVLDQLEAQVQSIRQQGGKNASYLAGFQGSSKGLHLTITEAHS